MLSRAQTNKRDRQGPSRGQRLTPREAGQCKLGWGRDDLRFGEQGGVAPRRTRPGAYVRRAGRVQLCLRPPFVVHSRVQRWGRERVKNACECVVIGCAFGGALTRHHPAQEGASMRSAGTGQPASRASRSGGRPVRRKQGRDLPPVGIYHQACDCAVFRWGCRKRGAG